MSRSRSTRFDWRGWRSAIVERLDRRTIVAALALAAFLAAFQVLNPGFKARYLIPIVAYSFTNVMTILLMLTVAVVAVARGTSRWIAYPLLALMAAVVAIAAGLVIDPSDFLFKVASPRWVAIVYVAGTGMLAIPAVLFVYHSDAAHSAIALRRLETERGAEAERVARQRLQAELATIDHELVLTAMRLALASPAAEAQHLLAAVSTYLRLAQQRDSTDPEGVATALAELRQLCANRGAPEQKEAA